MSMENVQNPDFLIRILDGSSSLVLNYYSKSGLNVQCILDAIWNAYCNFKPYKWSFYNSITK